MVSRVQAIEQFMTASDAFGSGINAD